MQRTDAHPAGLRREGLVLCRVGAHRLAFVAADVTVIDEGRADAPWAGTSFGVAGAAPQGSRQLWHEGSSVVVDSLEVYSEPTPLLPVPAALESVLGGAIAGFAEAAGALWPVVGLERLARELAREHHDLAAVAEQERF